MASSTQRGKTPTGGRPQDDWEDEQEKKVKSLEHKIRELTEKLNMLGTDYEKQMPSVNDHLQQLHAQVVASAPAGAVQGPRLPKAECFEGNRTKLRGFLTQMDMHMDMNKSKLPTEASRVIFVSTYLRGQAWDWFEPHIRDYYGKPKEAWSMTTTDIFDDYANFRQHLENTFGDIDAARTAERKLQRIRQNHSASAYASEFLQIISYLDLPDRAYIPYFEAGLKSDVKDELARIDRPSTLDQLIKVAVKIDNRNSERRRERQEMDQWKKGKSHGFNRYNSGRRDYHRPARDSDPYGPKPMELDATREEQDERKKKNLCFNCGKPGHRARECKQKKSYDKRPQLRATREELRATQESQNDWDWGNRLHERLLSVWTDQEAEQGLRQYDSAEEIEFPEIDLDTVESQGWTQHVSWEQQNESPGTVHDSQEWDTGLSGADQALLGTARDPGTGSTLLGTEHEIPETPIESPRNGHRQARSDEEADKNVAKLMEEIGTDYLDRHLVAAIEEDKEPEGCPCQDALCTCKGYARHPDHGKMATIMCYDETCTVHGPGKLDYGIEPRPLRWMKKPQWKPEYQGVWYNGRQIYDRDHQKIEQLAATTGFHIKLHVMLPMGKAWTLIDSGATNNFMNPRFVTDHEVPVVPLAQPIPVLGLDGAGLARGIMHTSSTLPMSTYGHPELIKFNILETGDYDIVLGIPWLRKHNPSINWQTEKITFNRCMCKKDYEEFETRRKGPSKQAAGTQSAQRIKTEKGPQRPQGVVDRQTKTIAPDATEQSPDMTDDELSQYVIVKHEKLYATSDEPRILDEYREFGDLFKAFAEGVLPEHGPFDHEINTMEGTEPTFKPIYQLSEKESQTLKEYIDENLKKGYIRPSKSSAGYPIIFVPKKDGSLRLCVDYRHLNSITIKDRHPLPLINEIQDRLCGAHWFSKYDITNAYHRIRIKPGHEWKTAFRTKFGHYEYVVMPFGLTNAPATFQRFIFKVLEEYLDIFVVAYLDDILVFSKTLEDHVKHNKLVLQKLRKAKVTLKLKKCEFHTQETSFLGYRISPNGLGMEEDKVKSITEWPTPKNVKEVQQFLGLANYYRKIIDGYAGVASGLYGLTKKDQKFEWNDAAEKSFQALKDLFSKGTVVATFDYDKPIIMETDASDFALGARLTQPGSDGKYRPVGFWSRKMIPAELNYDVHDKELLAIVSAFQVWRAYLEGAKYTVTVKSDHKNLTFFTTTKVLTRRQARWAETLAQYDFKIEHCKGTENSQADALSRRPDYEIGTKTAEPAVLKQNNDGTISYNKQILAATSELKDDEFTQQIREATTKDRLIQEIQENPKDNRVIDEDDGLVYLHGLIYIPTTLRNEVIRRHHDMPTHGHTGVEKTMEQITRNFYFPNMMRKVRNYIKDCDTCQRNKPARHAPYGELQLSEVPSRPWEWITMDFITKLPVSDNCDMIMVIVDRLTKYACMIPTSETIEASQMASLIIQHVFSNHGTPSKITSDRDKLFTSNMWQSFADQMGIELRLSTAYHPQTNGQTERVNQTIKQYLRCHVNYQQDDWASLLPMAQLAYNNAVHSTTGETPFFANYGYHPRILGDPIGKKPMAESSRILAGGLKQLHLQLSRDIEFLGLRMKMYYDRQHKEGPDLKKGEKVYLLRRNIKTKRPSNKLDHLRLGPFEIEEKLGPVSYRLKLPESMKRLHSVFHISLLEPAPENAKIATNVQIEEESEDEYEVEEILDRQRISGKPHYLVKWKGYDTSENTWEPIENLRDCHQLVQQYDHQAKATLQNHHQRHQRKKPGRPSKTRGGQPTPPRSDRSSDSRQ
jgi:transposase InsO family protein